MDAVRGACVVVGALAVGLTGIIARLRGEGSGAGPVAST
jgi:hypothetical protein